MPSSLGIGAVDDDDQLEALRQPLLLEKRLDARPQLARALVGGNDDAELDLGHRLLG